MDEVTAMTQQTVERRLAAIFVADVVGYSRMMGADETATLQALQEHRFALLDPTIGQHQGRVVKRMGDGILVEFQSVSEAVACALEPTAIESASSVTSTAAAAWSTVRALVPETVVPEADASKLTSTKP